MKVLVFLDDISQASSSSWKSREREREREREANQHQLRSDEEEAVRQILG
jgi:hypothetical protein